MLVVQEQHNHLSLPLQVGKGSYSVPALHGPSRCGHLPWLCTGLDLFAQWLFWLGTKDFKVQLDWMGWSNFSLVTSGLFRSNLVLAFQPRRSCAGLKEVVFCGADWYGNRTISSLFCSLVSCYSFLETLHQFFCMNIGCMAGRVHP